MSEAIHRYLEGEPPPYHDWATEVIGHLHPGAELVTWTRRDFDGVGGADAVIPKDLVRHRSNVARLEVLREHGGLWLDNDVVPLVNLLDHAPAYTAAFGRSREGCVMRFPAGHPFLVEAVARVGVAWTRRDFDGPGAARPGPLPRPGGLTLRRSVEVSGAMLLSSVRAAAGREPGCIPFDAVGRPTVFDGPPLAVHLWASSFARSTSSLRGNR